MTPKNAIIITGASSGIGEEFAVHCAGRGNVLVLVARSEDKLRALAERLLGRGAPEVHVCVADLARADGAAVVQQFLADNALAPLWLISNAGFGDANLFDELPQPRVLDCIQVNITTLVELTHRLLPQMRGLPGARIINVASTAAFQPIPYMSVYAATKAFVLSFSEGLHEELLDSSIRVTAVCPGPVRTNFAKSGGIPEDAFGGAVTAEHVVTRALRASDAGRAVVVTNQGLLIQLNRFAPRFVVRKIAAVFGRKFSGR